MRKINLSPYGKIVRKYRIDRGMSQMQMAKLLGCISPHISQTETGVRRPSPKFLEEVSRVLGLSIFEKEELFAKARISVNEVKIKLNNFSDEDKKLVVDFSDSLPMLEPEDKNRISDIIAFRLQAR